MATEKDAEAAAAVNVIAWRAAFHGIFSQQFLDSLSVEKRTDAIAARFALADYSMRVVLDDGGAVVGFADRGPPRETVAHDYELYALYVLPSHQRRGLGRGLLQSVASAILAEGRGSLMCSVLEENPHRPFYDRVGGSQIGRRSLWLDNAERGVLWYGWQWPDLAAMLTP